MRISKQLKEAMWTNPILVCPYCSTIFIMEWDASRHCIETMLKQEGKLVAFETNSKIRLC